MNINILFKNSSTKINYADILFAQRQWNTDGKDDDWWHVVHDVNGTSYDINFVNDTHTEDAEGYSYAIYNNDAKGDTDTSDYFNKKQVEEALQKAITEVNMSKGITETRSKGEFIFDALINNQPEDFWLKPSQRGVDIMTETKLQILALGNGIYSGHPERGWTFTTNAEICDTLNRRITSWSNEVARLQKSAA